MRRAVKRSSKRRRIFARDKWPSRSTAPMAPLMSSTTKPVSAVVDHFGHRAAIERDDRRAAGHGLDHHQAERLRPIDRNEQHDGAAQEFRFLLVGDLADIFDIARFDHRLDLFVEIVLVHPVDLGGDFERHAAMLRDADGAVDALFRRDAAEEREISRLDRLRRQQAAPAGRDGRCAPSAPAAAAGAANSRSTPPAPTKTYRTPADAPADRAGRAASSRTASTAGRTARTDNSRDESAGSRNRRRAR